MRLPPPTRRRRAAQASRGGRIHRRNSVTDAVRRTADAAAGYSINR
jgi:hypothetical protein